MISPSDFMKKHGFDDEDEKEHTLEENAKERARHLKPPNAGSPHDWEDWERYKAEHADDDEIADDDDEHPADR